MAGLVDGSASTAIFACGHNRAAMAAQSAGMKKFLLAVVILLIAPVAAGLLYAGKGYLDAVAASDALERRADAIVAEGRGGKALGEDRLRQLLLVQDPAFETHAGIDLSTPGAGLTTISQSVSKRLAFESFKPGIGKLRQTGYALGLESRLSKDRILALWLETLEMGRGPQGWMTGFFQASEAVYEAAPSALTDEQYFRLLAVLIAPGRYDLLSDDPELAERAGRISRLVAGVCAPNGNGDVWLDGCR